MSQSDLHVVFVSPLSPPAGGVATWTETIRKRGLGDGWRVSIVDTRLRGRTIADQKASLLVEAMRTARMLGSLLRTLVFDRPEIAHINCSLSERGTLRDALAVAVVRLFRVAVVSNLRGNFLPGERAAFSPLTQAAYRFIFRHSGQIVALNAASRDGVCELGDFANVISVMPNFVDLDAIPDQSEPENKRFRIAYIGALVESKGLATILEIASRLPESDFILVGDAPGAGESSHTIERALALANVELTGALPHSSVLDVLAASDALVFPSHSEGFPNVVAEAMAIGLPIVASPVGAIPEMIDEPAGGYLIPQDQIGGYVDAIRALASDRQFAKKMGAYNRDKARDRYSYGDVIARWLNIYESII